MVAIIASKTSAKQSRQAYGGAVISGGRRPAVPHNTQEESFSSPGCQPIDRFASMAFSIISIVRIRPVVAFGIFVVCMAFIVPLVLMSFLEKPEAFKKSQLFTQEEVEVSLVTLVQDALALESNISLVPRLALKADQKTAQKSAPKVDLSVPVPSEFKQELSQKDATDQVHKIIATTNQRHTQARSLAERIVIESAKQKYDPLFVAAVIKSESAFNEMAVSHVGAQGLMQIMPATGKYLMQKHTEHFPKAVKLTDPDVNIQLGIKYLRELESMYQGNRLLTLIAYNWGPGKLDRAIRSGRGVPKECIRYALKILRDHNLWQA